MWYAYYFGIQKEGEMKIKQKYQYGEFVFRIQDFMLRENEICLEGSEESLTAEVIRKTNIKARYDAACKMLLSNSMILSWILKCSVPEYREIEAGEIAKKYICGKAQTEKHPVHINEASQSGNGMTGAEDTTLYEGRITYDVKCEAILPETEGTVGIIIDLEGQNKMDLKYSLLKREIYYGCRLISSQYGTEFRHSDYGKLKHVYSIWICMNPPEYRRNTINRYEIMESCEVGAVTEKKQNYNLMTVITVCLGEPEDEKLAASENQSQSGVKLLRLLDILFFGEISVKEKQQILEKEYGIPMTEKLKAEVREMCNFSDGIEERGVRKGRQEGRQEALIQSLQNLMKNLGLPAEDAMSALGVPQIERGVYRKRLSEH